MSRIGLGERIKRTKEWLGILKAAAISTEEITPELRERFEAHPDRDMAIRLVLEIERKEKSTQELRELVGVE